MTTPRTDAEGCWHISEYGFHSLEKVTPDKAGWVPIKFARQLETELMALQEENKQYQKRHDELLELLRTERETASKFADALIKERDQLKEQLRQASGDETQLRIEQLQATVEGLREALEPLERLYRGQISNTGEYHPQLLDAARSLLERA